MASPASRKLPAAQERPMEDQAVPLQLMGTTYRRSPCHVVMEEPLYFKPMTDLLRLLVVELRFLKLNSYTELFIMMEYETVCNSYFELPNSILLHFSSSSKLLVLV